MDVHLTAPFRILRAASAYIRDAAKKERDAGEIVFRKVVNISSISGMLGVAGQANYSSAKARIIGLTKAIAKEWGRYYVNVNCVAFGLIETRLAQALGTEQAQIDVAGKKIAIGSQAANLEALKQSISLDRAGTAEEAAGAVCLFCYPESNYVSGPGDHLRRRTCLKDWCHESEVRKEMCSLPLAGESWGEGARDSARLSPRPSPAASRQPLPEAGEATSSSNFRLTTLDL